MSEAEGFGLPRNEETTTEELLLSLARKHKGRGLEIKAYTKTAESTNGADWAFWFTDSTWKGIGARIQAKRLFSDDGSYKSLFHQSSSQRKISATSGLPTPNQCETLLTHKDGLVPLYVFYNSDNLMLNAALSLHEKKEWMRQCGFAFPSPDWGISAASALAIKKAKWGKDNRPGDFPMLPWHYLVCARCWGRRSVGLTLPERISHGFRQLYSFALAAQGDDIAALVNLGLTFSPSDNSPAWVGLLREGGGALANLDDEMNRLNLKGVAVLQETEARHE